MNHPVETHRRERGHDFYPPAEVLAGVPSLYGTEEVDSDDKIIHLHYFIGACDWWVVELDADEMLAYGYACLGDPQNAEWGYISLTELESVLLLRNVPQVVERDLHWTPRPAKDVDLPGL